MLELGCAAGGNLIPMACAFPGSHFIGIDLSESEVADGRELVAALALKNIELKPLERFAFYKSVATPDLVLTVQTTDQGLYANLLLTIGVRV